MLAYEATNILLQPIEEASADHPDAACIVLDGAEFEGVSGVMSFDPEGDPIKTVAISRIADGQIEFVQFFRPTLPSR